MKLRPFVSPAENPFEFLELQCLQSLSRKRLDDGFQYALLSMLPPFVVFERSSIVAGRECQPKTEAMRPNLKLKLGHYPEAALGCTTDGPYSPKNLLSKRMC